MADDRRHRTSAVAFVGRLNSGPVMIAKVGIIWRLKAVA